MGKKDKEQVGYKPGRCCFHCTSFMPPPSPPEIHGYCTRVAGEIHPGSVCDLHRWAADDEGDDDCSLNNRKCANPSLTTLSDGQLRQLQLQQRGCRLFTTSEN